MTATYPNPRPRLRVIPVDPIPMPDRETAQQQLPDSDAARLAADRSGSRKRRLPNKGSFQKGVSGNLKGRPKGAKGVKPMIRKALSSLVDVKTSRGATKVAIFEALVKKEVALAADGDWRARRTVFELGKWALADNAGDTRGDSRNEDQGDERRRSPGEHQGE